MLRKPRLSDARLAGEQNEAPVTRAGAENPRARPRYRFLATVESCHLAIALT